VVAALVVMSASALLLALLERLPATRRERQPLLRPYLGSDLVYLLSGYVAGGSAAAAYVAAASEAVGRLGVPRLAALDVPFWAAVAASLVLIDLGNYLSHWLLHRFGPLWRLHEVHHSSRRLDWMATFRSHLLEQALRRAVAPVGLVFAGAPVGAVAVAAGLFQSWAMLNHANLALDLRWLEPVFVTPRLHHLHHVPETTHRNLGTLLTLWDRLRGALVVRELAAGEIYGVPGEVESYPQGWLRQLVEPLRRIA
jgi:sterol desaturase/sphingolipid hydroxylase (fatty acid hydroxylase superfamily)